MKEIMMKKNMINGEKSLKAKPSEELRGKMRK
jgi:hypothetical protein